MSHPKIIKTRNGNVHENKSRKSDAQTQRPNDANVKLLITSYRCRPTTPRRWTNNATESMDLLYFFVIYDPYFMYKHHRFDNDYSYLSIVTTF